MCSFLQGVPYFQLIFVKLSGILYWFLQIDQEVSTSNKLRLNSNNLCPNNFWEYFSSIFDWSCESRVSIIGEVKETADKYIASWWSTSITGCGRDRILNRFIDDKVIIIELETNTSSWAKVYYLIVIIFLNQSNFVIFVAGVLIRW